MKPTIGWSKFARDRHQEGTGASFFYHSHQDVVELVQMNWGRRKPGFGETTLDRKVVVPVDAYDFLIPMTNLVEGLPVRAEVTRRQAGEDLYVETYVEASPEIQPMRAKYCNIVCYSDEALRENNGERTTNDDWEIVAVLASQYEEEPMPPLTMARNYLEKVGGTKTEYTARQFAEAIYAGSQRGIKIKSLNPDKLTAEQLRSEIEKRVQWSKTLQAEIESLLISLFSKQFANDSSNSGNQS